MQCPWWQVNSSPLQVEKARVPSSSHAELSQTCSPNGWPLVAKALLASGTLRDSSTHEEAFLSKKMWLFWRPLETDEIITWFQLIKPST